MLGMSNPLEFPEIGGGNIVELPQIPGGIGGGGAPSIVYSPSIVIQGDADRQAVEAALEESEHRFEEWIMANFEMLFDRMDRNRSRRYYA